MKKVRIIDRGSFSFEIVEDDGETLESLAIQLAEALSAKSYYDGQESAFRLQSQNERRKAQERNTIIYQLKEYNRQKKHWSPDHKVSRMEPMETYDAELLEQERQELIKRANDFHEEADKFAKLAKDEQRKIIATQAKLNKARNGAKR